MAPALARELDELRLLLEDAWPAIRPRPGEPINERDAAEAVVAYARSGSDAGKWPLPREEPILTKLNTWVALREGDKDALKRAATWRDNRREYRIDPLADRISSAWASYLFGEELIVRAAEQAATDQTNYDNLILANALPSELERAAGLNSSEGEIWPRIYRDPVVSDWPLIDWVSRRNVLPYWVGSRLAGAAIVTELPTPPGANAPKGTVYRHLEVHTPGTVLNVLLIGKENELGERRDLAEHPQTDGLVEHWETGHRGMLLGRIPNRLRGDRRIGLSDYDGILDYLLDLNEAVAIGAHNMRLTARKRAIIKASAIRVGQRNDLEDADTSNASTPPQAKWDPTEEVFVEDPLDGELGRNSGDPIRILEYSFDAASLLEWKRDLVGSALSRAGLIAQYVGAESNTQDGYAISGTALRLRLIPTDSVGNSKARYWLPALPTLLSNLAQVDSRGVAETGIAGRSWSSPETPPVIQRRPGIPVDEAEQAMTLGTKVREGVMSRRQAVREQHPTWTESQVDEEVDAIEADRPTGGPGMFGGV